MPERFEVGLPDGVRLNVEATGPTDDQVAAILLHGWTLDGRAWHRQVDALTAPPFGGDVRVVAYDARGHGRSSCMALPTATVAQLGDDLAAVIDAVATGPVCWWGTRWAAWRSWSTPTATPRTSPPVPPAWSSSRPPPRGTRTPSTGSRRGSPG